MEKIKEIERGAADINIELSAGTITVRHSEGGTILLQIEDAELGSWCKIWDTLEAIKSAK